MKTSSNSLLATLNVFKYIQLCYYFSYFVNNNLKYRQKIDGNHNTDYLQK